MSNLPSHRENLELVITIGKPKDSLGVFALRKNSPTRGKTHGRARPGTQNGEDGLTDAEFTWMLPNLLRDQDDREGVVFVAYLGRSLVGYAVVGRRELDAGWIASVQDCRGTDVVLGEVFASCETWAYRQAAQGIEYLCVPGDHPMKSLGETNGYKARLLVMYKALR